VTISGALQAASGLPATLPSGARVAAEAVVASDGTLLREPSVNLDGFLYELDYGSMTRINSTRLPATSRLDVRTAWHPKDARGHWTFYLDVINVLNHRNRSAVFSELGYNPNGPRPLVVNDYGGGFPILPTFGIKRRF
jgi:hypothetical protein